MAIDRKALLQGVVANAKVFDGGDYLRAGIYEGGGLEIRNIIVDRKRNGLMFIVEFTVRNSKANGEKDGSGKDCLPHAVGTQPSFAVKLGDANGLGAGNMQSFLAALDDVDAKTLTPDQALDLAVAYSAPDQPARGMLIDDNAFVKPTKAKGTDFTHHRWKNVLQTIDSKPPKDENTPPETASEAVLRRRAAQESKGRAA